MSMQVNSEGVASQQELEGFTIITGTCKDFWRAIAGRVITVEPSPITAGRQRVFRPAAPPKDDGPDTTKAESGTPSDESGSDEDTDTVEEFYYCYGCQDAWDLDEEGFLDLTCPYCGATEITIVEMKEDDVRDLHDDWSFFHS